MRYSQGGTLRDQVTVLRRQFLQDGGLPFTDVLTEEVIADALTAVGRWLDRVFSPVVTLWVFLGQTLAADQSCRAAVARLIAHRVARGLDLYALWQFADGNCSERCEAFSILVELVDEIADALLARAVQVIAHVERRCAFVRMQKQVESKN